MLNKQSFETAVVDDLTDEPRRRNLTAEIESLKANIATMEALADRYEADIATQKALADAEASDTHDGVKHRWQCRQRQINLERDRDVILGVELPAHQAQLAAIERQLATPIAKEYRS
jgi:hypothetical protein